MEPKAATTSTSIPNKVHFQPAMPPIVEETQESLCSTKQFPRDYIPSRKPSAKQVHLQKKARYPLVEPPIPEGVIVEGDMLGMIPALKYVDHEIKDEKKFPELVPNTFLRKFITPENYMIVIEPQVFSRGLKNAGLLKLFDITHFRWN